MSVEKLTVAELSRALAERKVSSREATESYLGSIERQDGDIGAYLTITAERALEQANAIDRRRAVGEELGALAGVPMALKDNICTEGIRTTCASRMLENFVPLYSATVAKRLEQAGCVLLGKLNMDEFAMGSTTENSAFQKTRNPLDITRTPGGSSGGSAASVAACEAAFALGTDTGGSIRQPAAFCGVVGLKPTYGSVSRNGVVAFASSLDQVGPLTRTALDSAMVMNVLGGHDPLDSTSAPREYPDFTAVAKDGVNGMKIAVIREFFDSFVAPENQRSVLAAADDFRRMGAVVEDVSAPTIANALPAYFIISAAEASSNLARFDGIRYGHRASNAGSIEELYARSRGEGFGPEVKRRLMLGTYVLGENCRDAYYAQALRVRTLIVREFRSIFEKYDLILTPTTPATAHKLGDRNTDPETMYLSDMCTVAANLAGVPALDLPCGINSMGLPMGMQLIAPMFGEPAIYRAACAFERERGRI